jgi:hypothetical protein
MRLGLVLPARADRLAEVAPAPLRPPFLVGAWASSSSRWLRKAAEEYDGWIASAASTELETQYLESLELTRDTWEPAR